MTAKEYLGRAYRIDGRINAKLEQVSSLRELATKATSSISDMPRNPSPNPHSMQNIIAKIIDLENEINSDIDMLVNIKQDVVTTIKRVDNTEYQTLLELRYLCFKSWEQIALEMGYDLRYIHKLHNRALQNCKINFKEDTKRH